MSISGILTSERGASRAVRVIPFVLLVNTFGSFFVLLRLSTEVNDATGSGLLAGAVLSAPWLPALIMVKLLNRILGEREPTGLVRIAESASLCLTVLLIALPVTGTAFIFIAVSVVLVRGFFEAITRSATSVLLRLFVWAHRLNRANTFAEIGRLAGMGFGAAAAGAVSATVSPRAFFVFNAITLAGSVLLTRTLPRGTPGAEEPAEKAAVKAAGEAAEKAAEKTAGEAAGEAVKRGQRATRLRLENPASRRLFALFMLVAVWQGFHTVAVNVVPRQVLGGGTSLVGTFVICSAIAISVGSFGAPCIDRRLERVPNEFWALVPMVPLVISVLAARVAPTLIGYSVFLFCFELAYGVYNNRLLANARPDEVPIIVTLRATLLPSGVVVSILVAGLLSDLIGPLAALLAVVAVTVTVVAVPWLSVSARRVGLPSIRAGALRSVSPSSVKGGERT